MARPFLVPVQLPGDPGAPLHAAPKQYVDAQVGTREPAGTAAAAVAAHEAALNPHPQYLTEPEANALYQPLGGGSEGGGYRSGFVPADQGTTPVVLHNLGTSDLVVSVQDANGRLYTPVAWESVDAGGAPSEDAVRFTFSTAPTANQYRYTIVSAGPAPTVAEHHHAEYVTTDDLAGYATDADVTTAVSGKADDADVVHKSGNETVGGTKIFSSPPQVPVGTLLTHPVRRDDARLTDARTPTAHASSHGSGGSDPVTPAAIGAVPTTRQVTAGTGLSGGGDLTANRSLAVAYGSTAGTAVQGNDTRVTADQAVGTASIRTLGTGAQQAAPGNVVAAMRTQLFGGAARTRAPRCVLQASVDRTLIQNADVWQDTQWAVSLDTDSMWAPGIVGDGQGYVEIKIAGRYRVLFLATVGGTTNVYYANKITLNTTAVPTLSIASDNRFNNPGSGEPIYLRAEAQNRVLAVGDRLRFAIWTTGAAGWCYATWFNGIATQAVVEWIGPE